MATFYLLPPRECLEQAVAEFVRRIVPGVPVPESLCEQILDSLVGQAGDSYFVHREDLAGGPVAADLADGFGAEPGDAVIEVGTAVGNRPATVRAWTMPTAVPERAVG